MLHKSSCHVSILTYKCHYFYRNTVTIPVTYLASKSIFGESNPLPSTTLDHTLSSPSTSASMIVVDGIAPIPTKLIEKIQRWELIDLSRLLSIEPSILDCSVVVINGQLIRIEPYPQSRHSKLAISDIVSWMEAFSKYLAVLVSTEATSKEEAAGLVAYIHQV